MALHGESQKHCFPTKKPQINQKYCQYFKNLKNYKKNRLLIEPLKGPPVDPPVLQASRVPLWKLVPPEQQLPSAAYR